MARVCAELARAWPFEHMVDLTPLQGVAQYRRLIDFRTAVELLRNGLGLRRADSVYVVRNYQFVNELSLTAFGQGYNICYGDGLGRYDDARLHTERKSVSPHFSPGV
jgi:hypothetical protein